MGEGIQQQAGDDAIQIGQARDVYIGTRRLPSGAPFQAPAVPRYFVPRPEVSQALMDCLMADAPSGALVVSAVHGLGGIGKTTLVAALTHTPDVQARFPDGVLWATLGQQPDVLSLLAGWIQALGDYDFRPTVVESASAHLRTLLHDKACLLVVDDAWQADHARPFLVGGPRCRLVVTTRNAALARKVGARLYDLDVMTEAQALALFQARLGPLDGDREQAAALACELGYLPLALELAAAQVEAGLSWTELLDAFRQALADLAALDLDEATYRNESLRLSFHLSLEQLSSDDQDAFAWLGVLPEDARLNPAMAATLWDQPEADARRRLRRLRDRALLKPVGDVRYTLHDLLHDEAKLRLTGWMPLPEAHATLLERYRQKAPDEQWHRLPDDGYIHAHLTCHMEQAGQPEAIHALLRLETPEGHNAWYQAREALGQTAGYLADVARAWRRAEAMGDVGTQVQYALCHSSIATMSANVPAALLVQAVEYGLLSPEQALALVWGKLGERERMTALIALLPVLASRRPTLLEKAWAAARETGDKRVRVEALTCLASYLPESLGRQVLEEALDAAHEIGDDQARVEALTGLAPYLSEPKRIQALQEALAAAREIDSEWRRTKALTGLIPHLPGPERGRALQEALAIAREIESEWRQAEALAGLAPHLQQPLSRQVLRGALAAVQKTWHEGGRAELLTELAPHLVGELPGEALTVAREIESEWARAKALGGLVPYLPESLLGEALAAVQEIRDEITRAEALSGLAAYLPERRLKEALAATQEIGHEVARAKALSGLAPYLPEGLLEEALAAMRTISDEGARRVMLSGLALGLATSGYPAEALAAAQEIEFERDRAETLTRLSPHLPVELLEEALATAQRIGNEESRARAVSGLAIYLPESLLGNALVVARGIGDAYRQGRTLTALVLQLVESGYPAEALAACKIGEKWHRSNTLSSLALGLAESGYPAEALAVVQEIEFERDRAETLTRLTPHLPEELLGEALAAAREIEKPWYIKVLTTLAPHLPDPLREQLLEEILTAEWEKWYADDRAQALTGLALHLPEPSRGQALREALATTREIRSSSDRVEVLIGLVPHLPKELLGEALAAAREIKKEQRRAEALCCLALCLPEGLLEEALVAAREIGKEQRHAKTLNDLALHLPNSSRAQAFGETLVVVREIGSEWGCAEILARLAPHLPDELFDEALAAVQEIRDEEPRAKALAGLAPHLPDRLFGEALAVVRKIGNEWQRAEILARLAPHLPDGLFDEALVAVQEVRDEKLRARTLAGLAPHLPKEMLGDALAVARHITGKHRAEALSGLAPHLPEPLREQVLEEALAATQEIWSSGDQATVLASLAPYLSEPSRKSALQEALVAARDTTYEVDRAKALSALTPHLTVLSRPDLARLWLETQDGANLLHFLARRPRKELLSDLRALAPIIAKLGGPKAIEETFRAVQDVGRWWP